MKPKVRCMCKSYNAAEDIMKKKTGALNRYGKIKKANVTSFSNNLT